MTPAEENALVLNAAEFVANANADYAYPSAAIEGAIRLAIRTAYAKGLEDAAKACDELAELNRKSPTDSMWQWGECAAAIRGMK